MKFILTNTEDRDSKILPSVLDCLEVIDDMIGASSVNDLVHYERIIRLKGRVDDEKIEPFTIERVAA